jgi:hypothetical protein
MFSKNILAAVLLPFLLVFSGACGMDQPEKHDKKEICTALEEIAKSLRVTESSHNLEMGDVYRQDLSKQLSLLSEKLPYRKNKIDVLIKDLIKPISANYGGILTQALREICEDKKSIVEEAQEIRDGTLSLADKLRGLKILYTQAKSKKSTQRLLKLLSEQDIKDLEAIRIVLLSEQTNALVKDLEENRQFTPLERLELEVKNLKKDMYDVNRREFNIDALVNAKKKLKKIKLPEKKQETFNYRIEIEYMLAILKMWKAFDEGIELEPGDFATTILFIKDYIKFLDKKDIEKIIELTKNWQFASFIHTGFNKMDQKYKPFVLEACKKIREKIPTFPVPGEPAQSPSQIPVQAIISQQQDVPLVPVLPETHLAPEQTGETSGIVVKDRPELVALFRRWPKARVAVAEQPTPRAPQDNNQPQDLWTRVTTAFSSTIKELSDRISAGLLWLKRTFLGYYG